MAVGAAAGGPRFGAAAAPRRCRRAALLSCAAAPMQTPLLLRKP